MRFFLFSLILLFQCKYRPDHSQSGRLSSLFDKKAEFGEYSFHLDKIEIHDVLWTKYAQFLQTYIESLENIDPDLLKRLEDIHAVLMTFEEQSIPEFGLTTYVAYIKSKSFDWNTSTGAGLPVFEFKHSKIPKFKKINFNEDEFEFFKKIVMAVIVVTKENDPVVSHAGIHKSPLWMFSKKFKGFSKNLHGYAAYSISEIYNIKKYMITNPLPIMTTILIDTLGKKKLAIGLSSDGPIRKVGKDAYELYNDGKLIMGPSPLSDVNPSGFTNDETLVTIKLELLRELFINFFNMEKEKESGWIPRTTRH